MKIKTIDSAPFRRLCAAFVLVLAAAAIRAPAETKPAAAPPSAAPQAQAAAAPAAPATLQEASARLAKAQTSAEYAAMLDSFSSALPPSDSLSLLKQSLASSDAQAPSTAEARSPLLIKTGDLALLLGLFGDAASSYLEAASLVAVPAPEGGTARIPLAGATMLLRAARCELAAGDTEKALDITAKLILGSDDPDVSVSSRLIGAWALALQGRSAEAASLAVSLTQGSVAPEHRREARFIQWLCASADDKAKAAATLASEFPGSPEALIATGGAATPPLPHWYLGGLTAVAAPRTTAPGSAPAATAGPQTAAPSSATAAPGPARGRRLQVGYFSVEENARVLRDELASKGFAAAIEARTRAAGSGTAEEKRWIVTVDAANDIAKTRQSLKDAGYEANIIE